MVMDRRRMLWSALVGALTVAGLLLAAVSPGLGLAVLGVSVVALAALLVSLQRAARRTAGWTEPGPFYAGSGSGPRGPRTPAP